MTSNAPDSLREAIVAVKRRRDYHLMDEPDYIDQIMQLIEADKAAAIAAARWDGAIEAVEQYAITLKEQKESTLRGKE